VAVTLKQAADAMGQFRLGLPLAVMRGLRKGMPYALRLAKMKYMERKDNRHPTETYDPPNPPPGPLGIRQGNLVRTLKLGMMRWSGRKATATLEAGSPDVRYAKIHEFGGEIMARNGPFLIFPMAKPGGGYFIVKKPKVLIPARPYLRPALDDATPVILDRVVREIKTLARATLHGVARWK
jgi:hypothetical protein